MTAPDRFEIVAPLPFPGRHQHIALDRGSRPPRAVVLAFYPRALSDDPGRLARLSGEIERAAQLFHPNVLAPEGMEAVGEDLAAVTAWRDVVTLREILDAGGALPSDIAARIAADVCAGLAHAHTRREPVVHGLLGPEAVLVDERGTAALSGFGIPGGSGISDDLLGMGELLHECLVGEPPNGPSAPLDAPGVPARLAAVVNRARAAEVGARYPAAEALGAAVAGAVPLASRETVAAYLEAIIPPRSGLRAARRMKIEAALAAVASLPPAEISPRDAVHAKLPEPTPVPDEVAAPEPALTPAPAAIEGSIPMRTARSIPAERPSAVPAATAPLASTAQTSATTWTATWAAAPVTAAPAISIPAATSPLPSPAPRTSSAPPAAISTAPPSAATVRDIAAMIASLAPTAPPTPTMASAPRADSPSASVHAERSAGRGPRVPLGVAIAMSLGGVVIGFALARLAPWNGQAPTPPSAEARAPAETQASEPVAAAVSSASIGTPPPAEARPGSVSAPAKRRATVRHPEPPTYVRASGTGVLDVSAPEGAEIWLDGRHVGTGNTRKQISEGDHRVEVRHNGASVGERFHVAPGETWTYAVTPR